MSRKLTHSNQGVKHRNINIPNSLVLCSCMIIFGSHEQGVKYNLFLTHSIQSSSLNPGLAE